MKAFIFLFKTTIIAKFLSFGIVDTRWSNIQRTRGMSDKRNRRIIKRTLSDAFSNWKKVYTKNKLRSKMLSEKKFCKEKWGKFKEKIL